MRFIFLLSISLMLPAWAWADETGWLTGASVSAGDTIWTNTDSCFASDDKRAAYADGRNDSVIIHNFSAGVPAGATIDSIWVRIEGQGSASQQNRRRFMSAPTKDAATTAGNNERSDHDLDSDNTVTHIDGALPLWGTTWSVAEVNSSNFGVIVHKDAGFSNGVLLDYVSVRIAYTPAPEGKAQVMRTVIID